MSNVESPERPSHSVMTYLGLGPESAYGVYTPWGTLPTDLASSMLWCASVGVQTLVMASLMFWTGSMSWGGALWRGLAFTLALGLITGLVNNWLTLRQVRTDSQR